MIVYEPPGDLLLPRGSRIRKRELTGFVKTAAAQIPLRGPVSVLLTGDATIRELNRRFRKKNKATDVLSFPAAEAGGGRSAGLAGDLAVSVETALRQAEQAGHALEAELKILLLHGLLHLAGYDHETDNGAMRRREEALREQFELPRGLIARSGAPQEPRPARRAVAKGVAAVAAAESSQKRPDVKARRP